MLNACFGPQTLDGSSETEFQNSLADFVSSLEAAKRESIIDRLEKIAVHYDEQNSRGLAKPSPKFLAMIHGAGLQDIEKIEEQIQREQLQAALENDIESFVHSARNEIQAIRESVRIASAHLESLQSGADTINEFHQLIHISPITVGSYPEKFKAFNIREPWIVFEVTFKGKGSVFLHNFVLLDDNRGVASEACNIIFTSRPLPLKLSDSSPQIVFGCSVRYSNLELEKLQLMPKLMKLDEGLCDGRSDDCLISYPVRKGKSSSFLDSDKPYTMSELLGEVSKAQDKVESSRSEYESLCEKLGDKLSLRGHEFRLTAEQYLSVGCEGKQSPPV